MDRKMTLAAAVKRVPGAQPKVSKPKTISSKVKPKGTIPKRPKSITAKVKARPAPHVEPGYSLYSDDSIATNNDTSMEVLNLLRERKKDGKIGGSKASKIPFNNRLSSSTPDPERLSMENSDQYQMIPERDTTSVVWKDKLGKNAPYLPYTCFPPSVTPTFGIMGNSQGIMGDSQGFQAYSQGNPQQGFVGNFQTGNVGSQMLPGQVLPPFLAGNSEFYETYRNYYTDMMGVPMISSSQGFIPSQPLTMENDANGRESDIDALKAFIPTESTGFIPMQAPEKDVLKNTKVSFSSGSGERDKSTSLTTPDTSRSGYAALPKPHGNQNVIQDTQAVLTNQNGLYQIRSQTCKSAKKDVCDPEQYVTGEVIYPTPIANEARTPCSDGSYIQGTDVPEKDSDHFKQTTVIPMMQLHDSLSSITGSNSHDIETPCSQRSITPNSEVPVDTPCSKEEAGNQPASLVSQATPRNSSSSNSNKSVHFSPVEGQKVISPRSSRHCETQTDNSQSVSLRSGSSQGQPNVFVPGQGQSNVLIPGQGHFVMGQGGVIQQMPVNLQMMSAFPPGGTSDQNSALASSVYTDVPNPWSQVKTEAGLKKLRYYLKELKECGKINKDVETGRLVKDIEKTLETIPQLKSTFSLQAEINLAVQPLRNENAQLRRRLRLMGQYAQDIESKKEKGEGHVDFDTLQLQASNTALKRQLNEEKEKMVKMAAEVTDAHARLQKLQVEKNRLVASLSEKQTSELQTRQECLSDTQKLRAEMDKLQRQIQASQIRQLAVERENHILQVTIQQRDAEIQRQQEIVDAIKDSVSQLLHELEMSRTGADKSVLSNNSISYQRILHILDREHGISHNRSIRSDPGNISTYQNKPPPRLTAEVLATHNEREKIGEDIRGSTSDTEVDFIEREENIRKRSPKFRRRSVSTDGKILTDLNDYGRGRYRPTTDTRQYPSAKVSNHRTATWFTSGNKVRDRFGEHWGRTQNQYDFENQSDVEQSKISAANSRYSVTDYFRKYPSNANKALGDRYMLNDRLHARSVSFKESHHFDDRYHRRSLSQPESQKQAPISYSLSPYKSRSKTEKGKSQSKLRSPQEKLFQGTELDNSISAIDEDNISSVSEKTTTPSTASTVDENKFRKGIATLDANIMKLQLALQKTKSMLN